MQFLRVLSSLAVLATTALAQVDTGSPCSPDGSYNCGNDFTIIVVCSNGAWEEAASCSDTAGYLCVWPAGYPTPFCASE